MQFSSPRIAALLVTLLAASCATYADDSTGQSSSAVTEGTPEAVGVLRLLNDPNVDFETLDIDVALDRRAARNLIDHRAGPDGCFGCGFGVTDDNPFDSLAEVDAIKYVGPAAMGRLIAYAEANAYVPGPNDILGTFDDVPFTVLEAAETLALVNEESAGVLDIEVALDSRAVDGILEARPFDSMIELADAYYVGRSALTRLRDYVEPQTAARKDCRHHGECDGTDRCEGIPFDGSSDYGKCRPLATPPGVGASCDASDSCGPGLFCGGLTFGGGGMCINDWQHDTFVNDVQRFIPQQTPVPVATSVTVRGQATVPYDITVDIQLAHDDPHSLRIRLLDPNGADAVLWDGPNESGAFPTEPIVALGNISRDDMVNGRWLLQVENVDGSGLGNLHGWTLWLSSNFD